MDIYDPYARFDESNQIDRTAIIYECVSMGKNNIIGPYAVIGSNGEIRGVDKFSGRIDIGSGNVISELVTIQRPAEEGAITKIGDNNILMAHSHIGHDAQIGNETEICTGVIIGGYAVIEDGARIKIGSTVRNRKRVGTKAVCGMGSIVVKDVESNSVVVGNPAKPIK